MRRPFPSVVISRSTPTLPPARHVPRVDRSQRDAGQRIHPDSAVAAPSLVVMKSLANMTGQTMKATSPDSESVICFNRPARYGS